MVIEYDIVSRYIGLHLSGAFLPLPVCVWSSMGRRNEHGFRSVGFGADFANRFRVGVTKFVKEAV